MTALGAALTLFLTLSVAVGLAVAPAASGDPGDGPRKPAYPSQNQVDRAEARADQTAHDVGAIKGRLLLANQRLERANLRAEQASEAYNGAMWRLDEATRAYRQSRVDADRASRTVAAQRDRIGALVAQSYREGGDVSVLSAMMTADGPQGMLDQYAGFQGAATSLQADYQHFGATDALARVFEGEAKRAKAHQVRMAAKAEQARERAAAAAGAARTEAALVNTEKDELVAQLAIAQHVSLGLARQRQDALEEIARRRAEEQARRAAVRAEAKSRAEAAASVRAAEASARKRERERDDDGSGDGDGDGWTDPAPPPPPTTNPPPPRAGVRLAIRFAKAQLGEPYLWGAAGPSRWDCSGLTMKAWGAAGMYLPHFSGAQYLTGTPILIGDARAGDLLFWTSDGRPSGIHHVALYLGDGSFIEAPHTGANVRYNSIYVSYPDFAVRP